MTLPNATIYKDDETDDLLKRMPDVRPSQLFKRAVRDEAVERGLIDPLDDKSE